MERNEAQLEEARRLFEESESVLNILRTQTATKLKPPTEEEMLQWHEKLKQSSQ